ncbi:MAG: hypothetical protein ACYTEZ_08725 [Planctomycetota bacterium]|jgi:hypothetical protein
MPILLPGFASLWAYAWFRGFRVSFDISFGGFLLFLLLVIPASAVFGFLLQALRHVTFDLVRRLFHQDEPGYDSPQAQHYALHANLATYWAVLFLGVIIGRWDQWWEHAGRGIVALALFLLIEYGLIAAAMHAYHAAPAGVTRKRRTKKKA